METRPFSFFFQGGPIASYDVVSFQVDRALGRTSRALVEVYTPSPVDLDDLLGQGARIAFGRERLEHGFTGVVTGVTILATPEHDAPRGCRFRVQLSSLLGLLEQEVDSRIFQDMDVKEIVSDVMSSLGIGAKRQAWRIVGTYPKREYCVQYNESALAFLSRLMEDEGIYCFSEEGDRGEIIVFEDDSSVSDPLDDGHLLPYRYASAMAPEEDAIHRITQRHRTATGKVVLRDYDFKKPDIDLTATVEAETDTDLEVYDYPGFYTEPAEGQRLAQVRLEALQAERVVLEIESTCARLAPGRWIAIEDAPPPLDGEYFVTSTEHELRDGVLRARATIIPKTVPYRTPRRTPAPVIEGPQTAEVVAPPGSPAEEIHVDEHGRCKVKFHWDQYGTTDDKASCWMRVSQAQTGGSMIFPRVGWEVIVEFLEGSPDRPIITGRVYNGRWMPPYALPEGKSRTSIRTSSSPGGGGSNEIRFEDKAGSEEIMIRSQKNTTMATANNKKKSVGVNESKNVKVDATASVGANDTIKVTNGYLNTVGAAQTVSVGGSRTVEVNAVYGLTSAGASSTSVGGNQMEMDGSPIEALLALAAKAVTDAAKAEMNKALAQLDQAVSSKVDQVLGPIRNLENQVNQVSAGMEAVSNGDLGAAAGAFGAASGLPTAGRLGAAMLSPGGGAERRSPGGAAGADGASAQPPSAIDGLLGNALRPGAALGEALGLSGGGGGGSSGANVGGPSGAVGSNAAADSATGPGHSIYVCESTHTEKIGSLKAMIAAGGIHTTVKGARTQKVGAVRVELVAGTRAETCLASKTEKAIGLVVVSGSAESEDVAGSRTTLVGGAILEKIGGSHTVVAASAATFVGAFHKVDASTAIVFECGGSKVVIDGGGVTIQAATVNISAASVTMTKSVSQV